MHLTCKCLNVSIKTKGNQLKNINLDDINLGENEEADVFFKNKFATIDDLENITKELPGLVEIRNVGAWATHRCYNCSMHTHAVHRELGAALVLINTDIIMSEEEIRNLKASLDYSPVFRIVIDDSDNEFNEFESSIKLSVSQLSSRLRLALGGLEQQLEEAIRRENILVEERISAFSKEQLQNLENFRDKACNEHALLVRRICRKNQTLNSSDIIETPPVTPETIQPINKSTSENDVVDATADLTNNALRRNSSSSTKSSRRNVHAVNGHNKRNTYKKETNDYDQEALFILEGMDDTPQPVRHLQASDLDTDTDDSGSEEVYIPRSQRSGHPTLAKSLPVTVPAFHSFGQRIIQEDDNEQISRDPMDPNNIQASIKALAKSVHGDTVFGDLPRPRFSTQI